MLANKPTISTLLAQHQKLIFSRAHSFHRTTGVDYDDLVSEGYLIFCMAYRKFDPARGGKFSTFLYHCLNSKLYNYVRDLRRKRMETVTIQPDMASYSYGNFPILLASLSREARYVAEVFLYSPVEVLRLTGTETVNGIKVKLRKHLREQGWTWVKIHKTFKGIKEEL
jgi:RNA polymerase sigma factor (sigma-70 family)